MHRIDTAGAVAPGLFAAPNPLTGQVPVVIDSAWLNDLQENIVAVIAGAGIALVKGNYGQLLAAIQSLTPSQYATDTGAVNALAITLSPAPTALTAGLFARIWVANTNTGAVTLNVDGLGAVGVLFNGTPLAAGALVAGSIYEFCYDGTHFELLTFPAADGEVSNGYLATMAAGTVKANVTGAAATPTDVPIATLLGALGFYFSIAANGYLKFPAALGGLVIQWGTATVSSVSGGFGNAVVNFPTAYATVCYGVAGSAMNSDGASPTSTGNNYSAIFYSAGTATFSVRVDNEQGASGAGIQVFWISLGK